jgi:hypothetical protein
MRSSTKARHGQRALPSTQPNESAQLFADSESELKTVQNFAKTFAFFAKLCINRASARKRPHASYGKEQRASSFTCSACG